MSENRPRVLALELAGHPGTLRNPGTLPLARLLALIEDGAAAGYEVLRLVADAPFHHPWLVEILERAGQCTMERHVEGAVFDGARAGELRERVDAVTVRVAGSPTNHDELHGPGSFADLAAALPCLKEAGIPFGVRFCARPSTVGDVAAVTAFAVAEGADWMLVQRAASLDEGGGTIDAMGVLRLRALAGEVGRRHRGALRMMWELDPPGPSPAERPLLADAVPLLTVTADGSVHLGCPRLHPRIGNLHRADLPILHARWRTAAGWGLEQTA